MIAVAAHLLGNAIAAAATRTDAKPRWGGAVRDFRQLKVWDKAHHLTLEIYRVTANFPRAETYGLTSQLRRASASICANLAEGSGRDGGRELARFCGMASGSEGASYRRVTPFPESAGASAG